MKERQDTPREETKHPIRLSNARIHSDDIAHDLIPDVDRIERNQSSDYSKPVVGKEITIYSPQMQKLFEHVYVRTDYSLYVATKVLRTFERDDEARENETLITGLFDALSEEIQETIEKMQATLIERTNGTKAATITYDYRRTFEVPARTGFSTRLINITQQIDYLIALADAMEINNLITPETCSHDIKSWCRRYRKVCQAINIIRVQSMKKSTLTKSTVEPPRNEGENG